MWWKKIQQLTQAYCFPIPIVQVIDFRSIMIWKHVIEGRLRRTRRSTSLKPSIGNLIGNVLKMYWNFIETQWSFWSEIAITHSKVLFSSPKITSRLTSLTGPPGCDRGLDLSLITFLHYTTPSEHCNNSITTCMDYTNSFWMLTGNHIG